MISQMIKLKHREVTHQSPDYTGVSAPGFRFIFKVHAYMLSTARQRRCTLESTVFKAPSFTDCLHFCTQIA